MPPPNGHTLVSAAQLRDPSGVLVANATAIFTPNVPFITGGSFEAPRCKPVSTRVLNGAFSIELADTSKTNPKNISYNLTVTDNASGTVLLESEYRHLQPSGSAWSLDKYRPDSQGDGLVAQEIANAPFRIDSVTTLTMLMGAGFAPCNLDNGRGYGGAAPTDCTKAINTFLARATAFAPVHLFIDTGCLISGTLITATSNVTIEGLGWSTGFYLADGAGASSNMIQNGLGAGFNGAFVPLPTLQHNFALRNLRLNGNRKFYSSTDGKGHYTLGLVLANVRGARVENVWFYDICTYAAMFTNCTDIVCIGCKVDSPSNAGNTDGFHFNGNCYDIRVDSCYFNDGDDSIALNAPEVAPGPISRAVITNCVFNNCTSMLRAYTYTPAGSHPVSNIAVSNCVAVLKQDTAGYMSTGVILGVNALGAGKLVDGIRDFKMSNCTITSYGNICLVGDPCGDVVFDNVTWMAPTNANPFVGFMGEASISSLQWNNCRIYRTSEGNAGAFLLANVMPGQYQAANAHYTFGTLPSAVVCHVKRVVINGFAVCDSYGQEFAAIPYLIDPVYLSLNLIVNSLDGDKFTSVFDPTAGRTGVISIAGSGLKSCGVSIPGDLYTRVADHCDYVDATGAICVNVDRIKRAYTIS